MRKNFTIVLIILTALVPVHALAGPTGCVSKAGAPECSDCLDNDTDGKTDYPDDVQCSAFDDNDEKHLNTTSYPTIYVYSNYQIPSGIQQFYVTKTTGNGAVRNHEVLA